MPFEYEALVGHLYIVGGRAISATPPGALVEVAPTRAARGREADTFFVLVLPSGDALAPTAFYERMAQTAAEQYFDNTGSVTNALREMFTYLNQNLLEYNHGRQDKTYEANMICAVLRSDDLIIARVGSGVAVLRHQSLTETLPPDLSNDEALYTAPMGVNPLPDVKLSRHRVTNGSRLVLSDANLADFTPEQLTNAVASDDLSTLLVAFKELARLQLTMLTIEFVPPEVPTPPTAKEGKSTIEIAEAARAAKARTTTTSEIETGASIPAQRRRRNPFGKVGERVQVGLAGIAGRIARGLSLVNRTIEHYFGAPVESDGKRRWYTLPIATGIVLLIPVIIVGIVVALWLSGTGESAFEQCRNEAVRLADAAREVPPSNPNSRLTLWTTAMEAAQQCDPLRPDDITIQEILREGLEVSDQINVVERRPANLMYATPGASLDRVVLWQLDMYLLDKTNGLVYQAIIADTGLTFSRNPSPIALMRKGANVNGIAVGDFIDIAFSEQDDSIFALDRNGTLIQCKRRLSQECEAQKLLDPERWVNPVAITVWGRESRIYILDPGANQIWRYDRSGGSYVFGGQEYFGGQNTASITTAIDFAIDIEGVVFTLLSDGTMLRYRSGERIDFQYGGFPPNQAITSAQAMFLDVNPISLSVYIVSRNNRTIYKVGMTGTHRASYRILEEDWFSTLSGTVANASLGEGVIYAISGNAIFAISEQAPPTNSG